MPLGQFIESEGSAILNSCMLGQGLLNDAGVGGQTRVYVKMSSGIVGKAYSAPVVIHAGIKSVQSVAAEVQTGLRRSRFVLLKVELGVLDKRYTAPLQANAGVVSATTTRIEVYGGLRRVYCSPVHVYIRLSGTRQVHARVNVFRSDGAPEDITRHLRSVEIELGSIEMLGTGTGADIGVRNLTFELFNDRGDSFAPRDKTSSWNTVGGRWEPLLWPYRGVTCEVAVTEVGGTPTEWATLFEGYLGDNITTEHHSVSVSCRDKSKRLQDAYIDIPKTYDSGPYAAEELIQAIINDYVDEPLELHCPVPSGITFDEMKVEYIDVWTAVQNVAAQVGWFLGYRWNGTRYALTFMEPPRDKTSADFHFDWEEDVYRESLDIGDADIRNALTLTFRDSDTGERVTLSHRDHSTLRNDESIQEYTRRIMQIEEADISLIDTQEKALRFGEKIIWDLSELSATDRLELPLNPELDIFSTFTVENPLISSTIDFFSVQSIRHTLRFGEGAKFRTEVIATGRVVGAKSKWFDMETRPGRPGKPLDPERIPPGSMPPEKIEDGDIPPAIPTGLIAFPGFRLFVVRWHVPARATSYILAVSTDEGQSWEYIRVGGNYTAHSDLDLDKVYWYRVCAVGISGLVSEWSAVVRAGTPGKVSLSEEIIDEHDWMDVWNRASAITEDGKILAERIEGVLDGENVDFEPIMQEVARVEDTLDSEDPEVWYSSIRHAADEIVSEVTRIEGKLDSEDNEMWYSSIKQTAEEIENVVARLEEEEGTLQFSSITQLANQILSIVSDLSEGGETYSRIEQNAKSIISLVSDVADQGEQISVIAQSAEEVSSTVAKGFRFISGTITDLGPNTIFDATQDFYELLGMQSKVMNGKTLRITSGDADGEEYEIFSTAKHWISTTKNFGPNVAIGQTYEVVVPFSEIGSTVQQTAEQISLRVSAVDKFGNVIPAAAIKVGQVDGDGYIFLDAKEVFLPGTLHVFDEIPGVAAGGQIRIGDISGQDWGDSQLPYGTSGIWGDQAGLYLRGYARLLIAGSAEDEEIIDLTDFPNVSNPEILVAPKELVSYSPERDTLSHLYVDAVKVPGEQKYVVKAKTMVKGATHDNWGTMPETHSSWTFTRPTESTDGKKGVMTDFFICRPAWRVAAGGFGAYTARLWMDITDEFDSNGDPINWETIRTFSRSSSGSGTLNWDTALPHYGQWALRVRGQGGGAVLIKYAFTALDRAGYRTGDTYLDVEGRVIETPDPANTPSGMSAIYFAFDRG